MDTITSDRREEVWARYPSDAFHVLREAPLGRCRQPRCRAPIWWGETAKQRRRCPFDVKPDGSYTGTSHWRTCLERPAARGSEAR